MAWPRGAAVLALNPTLDVSYEVEHLVPGEKVASTYARFDPGGTGVPCGILQVLFGPSA